VSSISDHRLAQVFGGIRPECPRSQTQAPLCLIADHKQGDIRGFQFSQAAMNSSSSSVLLEFDANLLGSLC
jgi:hypothetical protein